VVNAKILIFWPAVAALSLCVLASDPMPPLGIIDFYGLRTVSEEQARQALRIKEGDPLPDNPTEAERRLEALPGVAQARINRVCCEQGKSLLYVGIQEKGTPVLKFRPAPQGAARLPEEISQAGDAFSQALTEAVVKGDIAEDDSQGHALNHAPALRAVQERFIMFAARDLKRLRDVLHHSSDPEQRAVATQVIAYTKDKRSVVHDLEEAMSDPAGEVRNNAIRALSVIANASLGPSRRHVRIDPQPFIVLLNSLDWTDRNKASWALYNLTSERDPATLAMLRKQALPSLLDIARWKAPGHAHSGFYLLGRIGGLTEEEINNAWLRRDLETVRNAIR
jgi:hypothetical protein